MHVNCATKRGVRGFSLVELVIVIVIIGVIAAIAIPRVSRGARGAGESSLSSNLSVLRNAIELYASEHNGDYPGAKSDGGTGAANSEAAFVGQLTKYSKITGEVNATRDVAAGFVYGPYLRKGIPPLPVGKNRGKTTVLIDTANATPAVSVNTGQGWVYNPTTGEIIANADDLNDGGDKAYNAY